MKANPEYSLTIEETLAYNRYLEERERFDGQPGGPDSGVP